MLCLCCVDGEERSWRAGRYHDLVECRDLSVSPREQGSREQGSVPPFQHKLSAGAGVSTAIPTQAERRSGRTVAERRRPSKTIPGTHMTQRHVEKVKIRGNANA